jgi:hypothetical protein
VFLFDVYPQAVRRARSPVAVGRIIVVVLTDLNKKWQASNGDEGDGNNMGNGDSDEAGRQKNSKGGLLLGTSLRDTYVMYPYHESHENRALGSPECRLIQYLITMRIRIPILRTKVHVE